MFFSQAVDFYIYTNIDGLTTTRYASELIDRLLGGSWYHNYEQLGPNIVGYLVL